MFILVSHFDVRETNILLRQMKNIKGMSQKVALIGVFPFSVGDASALNKIYSHQAVHTIVPIVSCIFQSFVLFR